MASVREMYRDRAVQCGVREVTPDEFACENTPFRPGNRLAVDRRHGHLRNVPLHRSGQQATFLLPESRAAVQQLVDDALHGKAGRPPRSAAPPIAEPDLPLPPVCLTAGGQRCGVNRS
jgi:hypothetical protein